MYKILLSLLFALSLNPLLAQVTINEISAANMNGITDVDGDREDWVELHNAGATSVNLSGWFLSDNPAAPLKWTFPAGINIPAGGYRIVYCSGKNKFAGGQAHTSFKLTQTKGESVVLTQSNNTTADTYTYTIPNQANHSYARSPNGNGAWNISAGPTPGAANTGTFYQAYADKVTADNGPGFYPAAIQVALSAPSGTIRYTTNGQEPTAASTQYTTPININANTVLKARVFSANAQILPGFILANTYFINTTHTLPVVSIAGDNVSSLFGGNNGTQPIGSFEYFENGEEKAEGYGIMNKHGNDSWAYPQRGIDWITRDQLGYKNELNEAFFPDRDRKRFQRLILKPAANDNYPFQAGGAYIRDAYIHTLSLRGGLHLDVRANQPCALYVNGQYWGLYELREKADDADYTKYYYNQDEEDIDYIKTWGGTWAEYGSMTEWNNLRNYILGNNMATQANYDYVKARLDVLSLIDYMIINQHTVCKDWLNYNTAWWRGRNPNGTAQRWRYVLWDMDATLGHYINYTNIPNTGAGANPCDIEAPQVSDPQGHVDILVALYNSPEFKSLYVNRYAELLNGPLSCPNMLALLDAMINEIAPEMPRQCSRWGGTVGGWQNNVQTLRNFINARCPVLNNAIEDCYDVTGPYTLTLDVSPAGAPNQAQINNIVPTAYPYTGSFFGGVQMPFQAKPAPGWVFSHWEVNGNTFGPNANVDSISLNFNTTGTVTAFFIPVGPCDPPTAMAASVNLNNQTINWTGTPSATAYEIEYRKTGAPTWKTATVPTANWPTDTLLGCSDYEMRIRSLCPQGNSDWANFNFSTLDKLADFDLPNATICNNNPATLDASNAGATYQWDDNSTNPTRSVTTGGQYWVETNLNGCTERDTVIVTQINTTFLLANTLCTGESVTVGTEIFDVARPNGQVVLPQAATGQCDSIVDVQLSFLPFSQILVAATNCDPAMVGIDTVFLTNAVGCDSLVITTVALVPTSQTNLMTNSCDPTMVGIDTLVLSNFYGCDSLIVTTTVLVNSNQTSLLAASCNPASIGIDTLILSNFYGCDSLVITTTTFDPAGVDVTYFFGQNCDPAMVGTDTVALSNTFGCDSLIVTTTTLAPVPPTLLAAVSCNPALVGIDTLVLANALGCDSLVITTTVFDPAGINTTQLSMLHCDPTLVGVDTVVLTNVTGCDSLVVTTTLLAPTSQSNQLAITCNPALVGTDTLILSNFYGCDSLVITTTTFDAATIPVTQLSALHCDISMVGVDTLIFASVAGCDSLVVTTTLLAPMSQINLAATSCNPALLGIDTLILSNFYGCDSLVITETNFHPDGIEVVDIAAFTCDPTLAGIQSVTLTNAAGCDSIVVTTTTLVPVNQTNLTVGSCNPALVGTDTLLLSNVYGCDSLVITTTNYDPTGITITQLYTTTCDPMQIGVDIATLTSIQGCDSMVVTTTTLAPSNQTQIAALTCDEAEAGTDSLLLTNQYGCDSLVITTTAFAGFELATSTERVHCYGEKTGSVELDSAFTSHLPVKVQLGSQTAQNYTGMPLNWSQMAAGNYTLTATNAVGCTTEQEVFVDQNPQLLLDLGPQPIKIHFGDSVWVEANTNFDIATAQWLPSDEHLRCPTCPSTFVLPHETSRYALTTTDDNGCTATASLTILLEKNIRVFVQNVLPLDGINPQNNLTVFTGPEVALVRALRIFDRWGNLIFEQKQLLPNTPSGWDGTYNGRPLPPGVIMWMAEVETIDGRTEIRSGDITVLR
jgi:hypothetical protein